MTAIITTDMRVKNADAFINTVSTESMYFYVGKTQAWPGSDVSVDIPEDTWHDQQTAWQRMFAMKKISGSDVSHAIARYNWSSGETYSAYDDADPLLSTKRFYVITDDLSVYKCLKTGTGASLYKPTGNSSSVNPVGGDGYIWKYMFTLSGTQAAKYLTNSFIPVQTLLADDGSYQWDVQQDAIAGAIHNIVVTSGGSGYDTLTTTITIEGDGVGCTAEPQISAGVLTGINVTNIGSGYNRAKVIITDTGSGAGGSCRAVISPPGGHGADPVSELGSFYTIANVELDGTEGGDFPIDNEYRQLGLILNPTDYGTTTVSTATTLRTTRSITYSGLSGGIFTPDDTITGGTSSSSAFIDSIDSVNSILYYHQEEETGYGDFQVGETISVGGTTATISSLGDPEVTPFSGQVLYIENRAPVNRASDQIEDVKLILEF